MLEKQPGWESYWVPNLWEGEEQVALRIYVAPVVGQYSIGAFTRVTYHDASPPDEVRAASIRSCSS
jgi:hypothetical protein